MEKGKTPLNEPELLQPKKRRSHRREMVVSPVVSRPWYERPPTGFSLPLHTRVIGPRGEGTEQHRQRRRRCRRVTVVRVVPPGVHAERSSRELVLHAAMPPISWIHLPPSFAFEMPPSGALELWLQHADCGTPATGAEVAVVAPGKVFMTRGWGEIAPVCRTVGALVIHLEYDGASLMFFKVFDAEGRRLECCPRESGRGNKLARTRPAHRSSSSSSGSSGGAGESSGSPELLATPETSDDSYEPPNSRRAQSGAAASSLRWH